MSMLDRIRQAGAAKGWDLQQVADACGIKRPQINQIASAKRSTSKHLPTIAKALGVPVQWLTTGDESHAPSWHKVPAEDEILAAHPSLLGELSWVQDHLRVGKAVSLAILALAQQKIKAARPQIETHRETAVVKPHALFVMEGAEHYQIESGLVLPLVATTGAASDGQRGIAFEHPELTQLRHGLALVRVYGDSASPVALEGQYAVIVDREPGPDHLALVETPDGLLLKRWCPQPDRLMVVLASPNGGRGSLTFPIAELGRRWLVVGILYPEAIKGL